MDTNKKAENTAMIGLLDGDEITAICLLRDGHPDQIGALLLTEFADPTQLEDMLLGIRDGVAARATLAAGQPTPADALVYDDLDEYLVQAWNDWRASWAYLMVEGFWYVYTPGVPNPIGPCYQLHPRRLVPVESPVEDPGTADRFGEGNDNRCFFCDELFEQCECPSDDDSDDDQDL